MLDLAEDLHRWMEEGRTFAVATVVAVGGSAPRGPGAALAVDSEGAVIGSVSGGCVEGAVYDLCVQALEHGETVVERFGYSDEDAFAVGLTCGGIIDVMVTPVGTQAPGIPVLRSALAAVVRDEPAALARVVRGPADLLGTALLVRPSEAVGEPSGPSRVSSYEGGLGGHTELDRTAAGQARAMLDAGRTGTVELSADGSRCPGGLTLLVESSVPPPRLIVFGATDFAAAVVRVGKFLGYHVTVCDARPVFATTSRFPEADDVVVDWPHRYLRGTATDARTVLCVLTHDTKFDVPLLEAALRMPAAFVGALGSRRTHADRERRLREVGLTEGELARLRSPIGLDLGARTPEETALSIAAEIIATRRGGTGAPLTGTGRPIHHEEERHDAGASSGPWTRSAALMRTSS
ncbi:XdhC family protein [Streptomyces sp. SAI-041]|uniref:XdhC family protein n=1 Tax=Streptomyces sp. SAI-041 TaxID=2940548 RepID=UPI00247720B5|nr:XdhC family protein [Streptomyces sp. SAI-041]MDH6554015.1 xanthine dehydrogenase accessory factor [Streptomyces sp. SAI-041]